MKGRGGALWVVALLGVVLGAAGLVMTLGRPTEAPTAAELAQVKADLAAARSELAAAEARLTASGPDASPIVNAATLNGLPADEFVRAVPGATGHYTCIAQAMGPSLPGYGWNANGQGIYLTAGDIGWFNCPVHLPDGATVTAFRGAVRDNSTTGQAVCYLQRYAFDWPADGSALAFTAYTGDVTTTGDTTLLDETIADAVVDNTKFAYVAECELSAERSKSLLLHGVAVDYRMPTAPGGEQ